MEANSTQNITTAGPEDQKLDDLIPALVQIFLTIIFGYVTGYLGVIGN